MSATHLPSPSAPPPDQGSAAGFVLVALGAVVAALGVMQLEVQGAPWAVAQPSARAVGVDKADSGAMLLRSAREAGNTGDKAQPSLMRPGASSGAASAEGRLYRTGDSSGQ